MMAVIPFFKKLAAPFFSWRLGGRPNAVVGIDIGAWSTKVVQLRYAGERAILETYGELLNEGYFKGAQATGSGFLRYSDADIAALLKDVIREVKVTSRDAIFSIPAASSFVITVALPRLSYKEIEQAVPFEARKYVPVPLSEVVLDWDILETDEERGTIEVLLVVVPKEILEKFKRIASLAGLSLRAVEVEVISAVRSLAGNELIPLALVILGHQTTTLTVVDKGRVRRSHHFTRGSQEITAALERGLGIERPRAETLKREIGVSERIEERETSSLIEPFLDTLFAELGRVTAGYNRRASRKIQRIILAGGGANLKGIVEIAATHFGIEVARGNPFSRVVAPAFLQPALREIGPGFAIATGLALREIASR